MRTRYKNTQYAHPYTQKAFWYASKDDGLGAYGPPSYSSPIEYNESFGYYGPGNVIGLTSHIEDELPNFATMGNCIHTKREFADLSPFVRRYYASEVPLSLSPGWDKGGPTDPPDYVYPGHASPSGLHKLFPGNGYVGCGRAVDARAHYMGNGVHWSNPDLLDESSHPFVDKRAELVPRVISRINTLELTTSIAEAREFPSLFSLFKRRERMRQALPDVMRYASYRGFNGDLDKAIRISLKEFANGSLWWFFGLSPTISDITKIVTEMKSNKASKAKRDSFSVTILDKSSSDTTVGNAPKNIVILDNHPSMQILRTSTRTQSITRVTGCKATYIRPPLVSDWMNQLNRNIETYLGVNPASTIWEVIPWSFAVDWLLSIDDVLDSLFMRSTDRWKFEWWRSMKHSVDVVTHCNFCTDISSTPDYWYNPILHYVPLNPVYRYKICEFTDKHSRFVRMRTEMPSLLSSFGTKLGGKQLYLAVLLALGRIPTKG